MHKKVFENLSFCSPSRLNDSKGELRFVSSFFILDGRTIGSLDGRVYFICSKQNTPSSCNSLVNPRSSNFPLALSVAAFQRNARRVIFLILSGIFTTFFPALKMRFSSSKQICHTHICVCLVIFFGKLWIRNADFSVPFCLQLYLCFAISIPLIFSRFLPYF